ncbi:MAG: hypothetical protein WAU68_08145 [Vitreimonas sp.]
MSQPETPNPEQKSNNAMLCLCIGLGLLALTWFLGVGTAFTAALSGGLAGVAMGVVGGVVLMLAACSGAVLVFVGIIWTILRVIADQRGTRDPYRDVQR